MKSIVSYFSLIFPSFLDMFLVLVALMNWQQHHKQSIDNRILCMEFRPWVVPMIKHRSSKHRTPCERLSKWIFYACLLQQQQEQQKHRKKRSYSNIQKIQKSRNSEQIKILESTHWSMLLLISLIKTSVIQKREETNRFMTYLKRLLTSNSCHF